MKVNKRILKLAGMAALRVKQDDDAPEYLKSFGRMMTASIKGQYKPKAGNFILAILAFLYLVSPVDFIPEIALGPIGVIDDFAIMFFGIRMMKKEINRFKDWEGMKSDWEHKQDKKNQIEIEDAKIVDGE